LFEKKGRYILIAYEKNSYIVFKFLPDTSILFDVFILFVFRSNKKKT